MFSRRQESQQVTFVTRCPQMQIQVNAAYNLTNLLFTTSISIVLINMPLSSFPCQVQAAHQSRHTHFVVCCQQLSLIIAVLYLLLWIQFDNSIGKFQFMQSFMRSFSFSFLLHALCIPFFLFASLFCTAGTVGQGQAQQSTQPGEVQEALMARARARDRAREAQRAAAAHTQAIQEQAHQTQLDELLARPDPGPDCLICLEPLGNDRAVWLWSCTDTHALCYIFKLLSRVSQTRLSYEIVLVTSYSAFDKSSEGQWYR